MDKVPALPNAWDSFWKPGRHTAAALSGELATTHLNHWWRSEMSAIAGQFPPDGGLRAADLGCGSGVVGSIARDSLSTRNLSGAALIFVDRSPYAAGTAARSGGGTGLVADLGALPLADASTLLVLSQFGVEYAGDQGLAEAARVIAPKGVMLALIHDRDGGPALECRLNLSLFDDVLSTRILDAARDAFHLGFALDKGERVNRSVETVRADLQSRMLRFDEIIRAPNQTTAMAFLRQARRDLGIMLNRRPAYEKSDIFKWLDNIEAELIQSRDRFAAMLRASRTQADLEAFASVLPASRFDCEPITRVTMPSGQSVGLRFCLRRR